MQVIRLPGWGLDYCEASYYGRRHSVHVGPFLILWGQMTEMELQAWDLARHLREERDYQRWAWSERAARPTTPGTGDGE